jgi:hypothetical protein
LQAARPPLTSTVGWGDGGGTPWQVPHAACEPSSCVHTGVVLLPPASVEPWQYVLAQVALGRSQVGAAPPSLETPPNVTVASGTAPGSVNTSMCPGVKTSIGRT